jgi:hypothetical protein
MRVGSYFYLKNCASGHWVGWRYAGRCIAFCVGCLCAIVAGVIRLALSFALELFFFFAFFRKLFLALFVRVIGSCHCVLS